MNQAIRVGRAGKNHEAGGSTGVGIVEATKDMESTAKPPFRMMIEISAECQNAPDCVRETTEISVEIIDPPGILSDGMDEIYTHVVKSEFAVLPDGISVQSEQTYYNEARAPDEDHFAAWIGGCVWNGKRRLARPTTLDAFMEGEK